MYKIQFPKFSPNFLQIANFAYCLMLPKKVDILKNNGNLIFDNSIYQIYCFIILTTASKIISSQKNTIYKQADNWHVFGRFQ